MKDIAESLGVSIVTVSKALRNHPDIAVETRNRILARVKELNYRPNLMARSLVTGHSELIGLVVPDLVHPFFGEIAKALSAELRRHNFFLIVSSSDGDPTLEQAEIEHLLAYRLDALVVASCQPTSLNLSRVIQQGTPLILLDRSYSNLNSHFVGADDYKIGALATKHLIDTGRTRIAHLRGPANSVGIGRMEGFLDTMHEHGLAVPPAYVSSKPKDSIQRREGHQAMKRACSPTIPRRKQSSASIDALALGAMEAAAETGIHVPRNLAIIGSGNYHFNDTLRVPLSSIEQGSVAMGKRLGQLILEIVASKGTLPPSRTIVKPKLVVRESTQI